MMAGLTLWNERTRVNVDMQPGEGEERVKSFSTAPKAARCAACNQALGASCRQDREGNWHCRRCAGQLATMSQFHGTPAATTASDVPPELMPDPPDFLQQGVSVTTVESPAPASLRDELLFCEACEGRFTAERLRDHDGQVLCLDCIKQRSNPRQMTMHRRSSAEIPERVQKVIATNPLILLAIVAAYLAILFPPLVLVVVWVARRLLTALGVACPATIKIPQ